MQLGIFLIILFSFFSNFFLYLIYKFFLGKRLSAIINILKQYDNRLEKITSAKRKEKVYRKVSKEIKSYSSTLYFYSFLQLILLLTFYFIGLFVITAYISLQVFLPFYVPLLTVQVNGKYEIVGGTLILFILSFILFTPLSLRRPKEI